MNREGGKFHETKKLEQDSPVRENDFATHSRKLGVASFTAADKRWFIYRCADFLEIFDPSPPKAWHPTNQPTSQGSKGFIGPCTTPARKRGEINYTHGVQPASPLLPLSGPLNRPWNLWSRNLSLDCAPRDALKDKIQRGRGNYKEKIITHIFHYFNRRFSCVYNL